MNDNCCSTFRPRGDRRRGDGSEEAGLLSVTSATVGLKLYHSHFPRQVMNDSLVYPLTALDERGCGAQFLTPWQPLSKTASSRNLDPDVLPSVQPRLGCPESEAGHDASLVRVLPILRTNRSFVGRGSFARSKRSSTGCVYLGARAPSPSLASLWPLRQE